MEKIRVGILSGAITNAGDFLILNRGMELLKNNLKDVELIKVNRNQQFHGDFEVLIILGGPIVSRNINYQIKNIQHYLEKNDVPVICLGIGISGEPYTTHETYFLDNETIMFWKKIYNSSKLISVRDLETFLIFKKIGINPTLTGCPALFDLDYINNRKSTDKNLKQIKLIITIPQLRKDFNVDNRTKSFLKTFEEKIYAFSFFGIIKLVNVFINDLKYSQAPKNKINPQILKLYPKMSFFLTKVNTLLKEYN